MPTATSVKEFEEIVIANIEKIVSEAMTNGHIERYRIDGPDNENKVRVDIKFKKNKDRIVITINQIKETGK